MNSESRRFTTLGVIAAISPFQLFKVESGAGQPTFVAAQETLTKPFIDLKAIEQWPARAPEKPNCRWNKQMSGHQKSWTETDAAESALRDAQMKPITGSDLQGMQSAFSKVQVVTACGAFLLVLTHISNALEQQNNSLLGINNTIQDGARYL